MHNGGTRSDLINIDILLIATIIPVLVKLHIVIHTLMTIPTTNTQTSQQSSPSPKNQNQTQQRTSQHIRIRLIDLRRLRQLPIRLQTPRLVRTVLEYDVPLLVLIVPQRQQYDVALVDPDFLPEFAADVREALFAVEAEGFETAVAEHFDDLCVF